MTRNLEAILIPVPMKGTIISQKNTHLLYIFNPRTYERYNQPISGTDRLMYALIPVPTKGTIKNIIFRSINKRILIPVPVKGTMGIRCL